jgi:hypothetical protein
MSLDKMENIDMIDELIQRASWSFILRQAVADLQ